MTQNFDVIIIGAGVMGTSLAFHLSKRGLKPLLVEKNQVGFGATGSSSGLVRMHYDLKVESQLAWESFHYFKNWAEVVGGECGFRRTGFIHLEPAEQHHNLRANVEMQKGIGIKTEIITGADVKKLSPSFYTDDIEIAAYEPESGYADATLTANSFLTAAKNLGTVFMQDCEVIGSQISHGAVTGIRTSRGDFFAPIVINAAGAWAGKISEMFEYPIQLSTWTHDVLHIRRPAHVEEHLTVIDMQRGLYFRPDTGNLTLVALTDDSRFGESPDADRHYVEKDFVERAIERVIGRVPALEQGSLHSTHVGRDSLTKDQRAIIGKAGPEGYYLVTGFSGTGFKISPAVGLCVSELIVDGEAKTIDISGFDPKRFERGEILKGEFDYGFIWGNEPHA